MVMFSGMSFVCDLSFGQLLHLMIKRVTPSMKASSGDIVLTPAVACLALRLPWTGVALSVISLRSSEDDFHPCCRGFGLG